MTIAPISPKLQQIVDKHFENGMLLSIDRKIYLLAIAAIAFIAILCSLPLDIAVGATIATCLILSCKENFFPQDVPLIPVDTTLTFEESKIIEEALRDTVQLHPICAAFLRSVPSNRRLHNDLKLYMQNTTDALRRRATAEINWIHLAVKLQVRELKAPIEI